MKTIIDTNIGKVEVNEGLFTGKFSLTVNNVTAEKTTKRYFKYNDGENDHTLVILGNHFSGLFLSVDKKYYTICEKLPIYIYILGFIPFVMTMVLGTIPTFAQAGFYYVGGAIGGAISGGLSLVGIFLASYVKKWYFRLLIVIVSIIVTFLICFGIGNLIVYLATN